MDNINNPRAIAWFLGLGVHQRGPGLAEVSWPGVF
jgi:hypothetical protein